MTRKTSLLIAVGLTFAVMIALAAFRARDPRTDSAASHLPARDSTQRQMPVPPTANAVRRRPDLEVPVSGALTLIGSVQSARQATLSVRQPARIARVLVREGQAVSRNSLVIEMDSSDYLAQERTLQAGIAAAVAQVLRARAARSSQLTKADADVASADSAIRQAETRVEQARLARDAAQTDTRNEQIVAREGARKANAALARARQTLRGLEQLSTVGGVARTDLEGARTQVTVAESDLSAALAQVKRLEDGPGGQGAPNYRVAAAGRDVESAELAAAQARMGLKTALRARSDTQALAEQEIRTTEAATEQARASLYALRQTAESATRLRAPLNGVVTAVGARAGETAQPGAPLATLVSLDGLHALALASGRQLASLKVGQQASIIVDTRPRDSFAARVSQIARVADPDGRTFRVKFQFSAPHPAVRPGQTARITVRL